MILNRKNEHPQIHPQNNDNIKIVLLYIRMVTQKLINAKVKL